MSIFPGIQIVDFSLRDPHKEKIRAYLQAMRCPPSIRPGAFGLWTITRVGRTFPQTLLWRQTLGMLHLAVHGDLVMEDSNQELRKHLPAVLAARGRVLVSGLGLGCVVRGLLANPEVDEITVLERDCRIIQRIGPTLDGTRAKVIHADAATWEPPSGARYDLAWHDCWTDESAGEPHLAVLHSALMIRFLPHTERQGAWEFPRQFKRAWRQKANYLRRA